MIRLPDKELFRPDEVKDLLNLKRVETVYGWIREGKIKYVLTPGNQKRIPRAELEHITRERQEAALARSKQGLPRSHNRQ